MTLFERLCIFGIWVGGIAILFILVWGMSGCSAIAGFDNKSRCEAKCECLPCDSMDIKVER